MRTSTRARPTRHSEDILADYLGPAEVVEAGPVSVRVRVAGVHTQARLALAVPYEPAVGDTLLLVSRRGEAYVIGVLDGRGQTSLSVSGDVELRAVGGKLRLRGDEGVQIEGRSLSLVAADKLRIVAQDAVSHYQTLSRKVRGLFSSQAEDKIETVDGSRIERSKRATLLTEETMSINGKEIHLG